MIPAPRQQLRNGATVIKAGQGYVLAIGPQNYVTWAIDDNGDTFWGHYFPLTIEGLAEATTDFVQRIR